MSFISLTIHDCTVAGNTNPGFFPVHVHQSAFQTTTSSTEHLARHTSQKTFALIKNNLSRKW